MTLDEIRQFLDGPAIVSLKGDEFAGLTGNGAIKRAVYDSYARVKWEVSNAGIGAVQLTKSGINDSMRHGYGREKLAAFAAVPEVIRDGVVVDHSPNWKERGYESFVVAAPISIAGVAYCAFVIVNSVRDGGHRFYLHEVGKIEDMKKIRGLTIWVFGLLRTVQYPRFGKKFSIFAFQRQWGLQERKMLMVAGGESQAAFER